MKTPFNVNGYVWVKLTPAGLKILENAHNWLRASFPNLPEFTPPETDSDGFTKYQLWSLMNDFGQYMRLGGKIPFETEVFFETKEK
jgi:repressor LexA